MEQFYFLIFAVVTCANMAPIFIVFFETVLGKEHSGKVSKKFIGNFYF